MRLLGCDIVVSGIAAAIATTLTHLDISLGNIKTARSPQEALERYQHLVGQPAAHNGLGVSRYGTNSARDWVRPLADAARPCAATDLGALWQEDALL